MLSLVVFSLNEQNLKYYVLAITLSSMKHSKSNRNQCFQRHIISSNEVKRSAASKATYCWFMICQTISSDAMMQVFVIVHPNGE